MKIRHALLAVFLVPFFALTAQASPHDTDPVVELEDAANAAEIKQGNAAEHGFVKRTQDAQRDAQAEGQQGSQDQRQPAAANE